MVCTQACRIYWVGGGGEGEGGNCNVWVSPVCIWRHFTLNDMETTTCGFLSFAI